MIDLLQNKTSTEKAKIKSQEIAKLDLRGKFTDKNYEVEIVSPIQHIEIGGLHGIEFFAKAWKNGKPIGFGKYGTVETERFRIYNPPVLIEDPNGDIDRSSVNKMTGETIVRKLREDSTQAIKETLAHIIKVTGKDDGNVVRGTFGNTTSTFYPDAHTESVSVDGSVLATRSTTFSTSRNDTTGLTHWDNVAIDDAVRVGYGSAVSLNWDIIRAFLLFNTAAIPDTDIISSATLSVYGSAVNYQDQRNDGYDYLAVIETAPTSDTDLVNGDIDNVRDTSGNMPLSSGTDLKQMSDQIDIGSYNTGGYNVFTLNASGLAVISKTGITKLGVAEGHDIQQYSTGWSNGEWNNVRFYYADQTGTANDPLLTVVHVAVPTNYTTTCVANLSMTSSLLKTTTFNKSKTETLNQTGVRSGNAGYAKSKTETLSLSGTVQKLWSVVKNFTDSLSLSDTSIIYKFIDLVILEVLSLTETLTRSAIYTITKSEILSLSETISKGWTTFVNKLETLTLSEILTTIRISIKTFTETLNISDSLTKTTNFLKSKTETLSLSESLTKLRTAIVTILETLTLSTSKTLASVWSKTISATLSITSWMTKDAKGWFELTKHISTWTNKSKNNSTWTFRDKSPDS